MGMPRLLIKSELLRQHNGSSSSYQERKVNWYPRKIPHLQSDTREHSNKWQEYVKAKRHIRYGNSRRNQ